MMDRIRWSSIAHSGCVGATCRLCVCHTMRSARLATNKTVLFSVHVGLRLASAVTSAVRSLRGQAGHAACPCASSQSPALVLFGPRANTVTRGAQEPQCLSRWRRSAKWRPKGVSHGTQLTEKGEA